MPGGEMPNHAECAHSFVFWAVANHLADCASCRNYTRNVHVISQKVDSPLAHQRKKRK
jgi:predicted anti-sigma-YlaC factor YlaD